jgi:protein CrcB
MSTYAIVAVGLSAALGVAALGGLSHCFNPVFPTLPLGTLLANLLGGYLIGVAIEYFAHHGGVSAEAHLFIITGFLGGLTTFSTFSGGRDVARTPSIWLGNAAGARAGNPAGCPPRGQPVGQRTPS